jgi:diguanylate cyclase (GGDEF)-like protein
MGKPQTILYMFTASLSSAAVASTLSILRSESLYNNTAVIAWLAWFSEQFSTNLLLLPVLLAAPRLKQLLRMQINWQLRASMPLLALLFSLVFSVYIGGPGAIAFPIPALLWCAVRYQLFTVTLLTLLTGMTEISSISANLMLYETPNNHNAFLDTLMSARLGIAMLVMGPLILASSIAVNRKLLRRLEHSANHDFLTGVLARNALTRKAGELLEHKHKSKEAVSLLLIDIDHFKQINDTHGHLVGDQVLASFAHIVRRELRHDQLFGRLGGEEFAIILPRALAAQGVALAEHLRQLVQKADLHPGGKALLNITISVGVASLAMNEVKSWEQLMNMADIALYRAKSQGRNRVESFNVVSGNSVGHIMFK